MKAVKKETTFDHQVNSKRRIADHGEVFTSKREVNAMLDLVKQETERIESRFLEPACGNGNFLAEILERKLTVVVNRYKKSQLEFERNAITAVSSVYGIDILEDNTFACRERLLGIFTKFYSQNYKLNVNPKVVDSVVYLLSKNIIWADALSLMTVGKNTIPIVFSEWSPFNGSMLKRRDYTFEHLVISIHGSLFSDLGDDAYIPTPIKEFPLTHFLEISKYD
jgi:SAM-dependent methyltransferase